MGHEKIRLLFLWIQKYFDILIAGSTDTTLDIDENSLVGTVIGTVKGKESSTGDKAGTPHADLIFRSVQ